MVYVEFVTSSFSSYLEKKNTSVLIMLNLLNKESNLASHKIDIRVNSLPSLNDLPNVLSSPPQLSADDIFLLYSSNDIHQLKSLCNRELLQVKQWINANKLVINLKKSQTCIIDYRIYSIITRKILN